LNEGVAPQATSVIQLTAVKFHQLEMFKSVEKQLVSEKLKILG